MLPLRNVDLVIVAIGENFGASIKTVALLRQAGVKHIYARAIDKLHEAILASFEIDRIITPEQRAAADLSHELELGSAMQTLPVDGDHAVVNFAATEYLLGISYHDLAQRLAEDFGISLVAACRLTDRTNVLGITRAEPAVIDIAKSASTQVVRGDRLTLFGSRKQLRDLCRKVN